MNLGMSHSDDRRRRLLTEESTAEPSKTRVGAPSSPMPGYADAARRQHQPHLTDVVPLRPWVHAALVALAALGVSAVVAAYLFVPHATDGRWPLLDLGRDGSLAAWLGAVALACAVPASLLIYSVRRHRLDDYRGRYRMWLAAVPVMLWLSLEQTAALGDTLREALYGVTGWSWFAAAAPYWTLTLAGLLIALTTRLAFETRGCRTATAGVILAGLLVCSGFVVKLGWISLSGDQARTATEAGLYLTASLLLLSSLTLYARHVVLAADGKLAVRMKRPRIRIAKTDETSAPEAAESGAKKRVAAVAKIDPPQPLKGPVTSRTDLAEPAVAAKPQTAAARSAASAPTPTRSSKASLPDDDEDEHDGGPRKLSKAERKALKRQRQMADEDQDDWWERGD
jgi:hypothetical protein